MGLVVQKYGGSSVADATSIKRVATRIVEARNAGHDVCVVVSAMGDTTDELIDLAEVNGHVFVNNSSIGLYPQMVLHWARESGQVRKEAALSGCRGCRRRARPEP